MNSTSPWKNSKTNGMSISLNDIKIKVDDLKKTRDLAKRGLTEAETELTELKTRLDAAEEALLAAQSIARDIQEQVHQRISEIVSTCVQAVFGENYSFNIEFVERRSKTEADLRLLKDDVPRDLLTECGGGVVDIVSFALRVAALTLHRPELMPLLVLDEPFKYLSASYRPAAAELLQTLSDDLDIQIVMVTHIPELEIGKVIEL